jgi:hypothetical protein
MKIGRGNRNGNLTKHGETAIDTDDLPTVPLHFSLYPKNLEPLQRRYEPSAPHQSETEEGVAIQIAYQQNWYTKRYTDALLEHYNHR